MIPSPPFLFADISAWQPVPHPALLGPSWRGVLCKATEGLHYAPEWFLHAWAALRARPDLLLGWYHYLRFGLDGAQQADYALAHVDRAGGTRCGDIRAVLDVERGNPANHGASAQQVIDCASAFSARYHERTGHRPILYGRGAMRDLGITSDLGCQEAIDPDYEPTINTHGLEAFGLDHVVLWQYSNGKRRLTPKHLPWKSPIGGDCNVYIQGAEVPIYDRLVERLCIL